MIAAQHGRNLGRALVALTMVGALDGAAGLALAQGRGAAASRPGVAVKPPAEAEPQGVVEMKSMPANPNDAVAVVNGEVITRAQLASECVARKGEEILETMIARRMVEQALKANKLEVTGAEVDAEIERVALQMAGVSREQWLRHLAKEKNISPAQYAKDVIYPALALRKLAAARVQVTEQDLKDAYDAEFGDRVVYRMIMTRSLDHAKQVWEELKKNPAGFEHLAMNDPRSIDPSTRSSGGKPVNGPLQRHAYPREVTDKIFAQLVDGDPADKDPTHKPKDGELTGPIQVTDQTWLIVKREGLIPARPYDPKNPELDKQMRAAVAESKVQQHMEEVYGELTKASAIENRLTGTIKQANREIQQTAQTAFENGARQMVPVPDGPKADPQTRPASATTGVAPSAATLPAAPPTVSPADVKMREKLLKDQAAPATAPKGGK